MAVSVKGESEGMVAQVVLLLRRMLGARSARVTPTGLC